MSNLWMRRYVNANIVIGFILLLFTNMYIKDFSMEVYGVVSKSFFIVSIENYYDVIKIVNIPIIIYLTITIVNVIVYVKWGQHQEHPTLRDVSILNGIITFTMILGQLLFILLIPSTINGEIINRLFYVDMPRLSTDIIKVFNTNYVLAFGYIFYNMYASLRTLPPKEVIEEEDDEVLPTFLQD